MNLNVHYGFTMKTIQNTENVQEGSLLTLGRVRYPSLSLVL